MSSNPYNTRQHKARVITWKCPFCPREVAIAAEVGGYIGIMTVHHFNQRHNITKEGILAYAPSFQEAVAEYFG